MADYHHYVAGFFSGAGPAQELRQQLRSEGFQPEQLLLFGPHSITPVETLAAVDAKADPSQQTLNNILVDGAIGTAVGTGLGALVDVALVATHISLFIANPLLTSLTLLGWGASVGALVGASVGATEPTPNRPLAELVRDAVRAGQWVLVVDTTTQQQTDTARKRVEQSTLQQPLPTQTAEQAPP